MLTFGAAFETRTALAFRQSRLGSLPFETLRRLRVGEYRLDVPAGSLMPLPCDRPHLGLVVDGLLRVSIAGPDGRLLTLRAIRPSELIGSPSIVGQATSIADFRAVVDTSIIVFDVARAEELAVRDAAFAMALAEDLGMMVRAVVAALAAAAFGSVRQRLARNLIDLAMGADTHGRPVVPLTQQELADAIGSVREVVARSLGELREEALIATRPGRIVVLDLMGLRGVAWGFADSTAAGTEVEARLLAAAAS